MKMEATPEVEVLAESSPAPPAAPTKRKLSSSDSEEEPEEYKRQRCWLSSRSEQVAQLEKDDREAKESLFKYGASAREIRRNALKREAIRLLSLAFGKLAGFNESESVSELLREKFLDLSKPLEDILFDITSKVSVDKYTAENMYDPSHVYMGIFGSIAKTLALVAANTNMYLIPSVERIMRAIGRPVFRCWYNKSWQQIWHDIIHGDTTSDPSSITLDDIFEYPFNKYQEAEDYNNPKVIGFAHMNAPTMDDFFIRESPYPLVPSDALTDPYMTRPKSEETTWARLMNRQWCIGRSYVKLGFTMLAHELSPANETVTLGDLDRLMYMEWEDEMDTFCYVDGGFYRMMENAYSSKRIKTEEDHSSKLLLVSENITNFGLKVQLASHMNCYLGLDDQNVRREVWGDVNINSEHSFDIMEDVLASVYDRCKTEKHVLELNNEMIPPTVLKSVYFITAIDGQPEVHCTFDNFEKHCSSAEKHCSSDNP